MSNSIRSQLTFPFGILYCSDAIIGHFDGISKCFSQIVYGISKCLLLAEVLVLVGEFLHHFQESALMYFLSIFGEAWPVTVRQGVGVPSPSKCAWRALEGRISDDGPPGSRRTVTARSLYRASLLSCQMLISHPLSLFCL